MTDEIVGLWHLPSGPITPQRPGGGAEGTFVPISVWILLLKSFCHLPTVTQNSDKNPPPKPNTKKLEKKHFLMLVGKSEIGTIFFGVVPIWSNLLVSKTQNSL